MTRRCRGHGRGFQGGLESGFVGRLKGRSECRLQRWFEAIKVQDAKNRIKAGSHQKINTKNTVRWLGNEGTNM